MKPNRREFIQNALAPAAMPGLRLDRQQPAAGSQLAQPGVAAQPAQAAPRGSGRRKVIYDQDHRGPLSTDTVATLLLLQADNVDMLGITTVTGDQWVKQETAYALRLLEIMGRTEVPVFMGADIPLLNTKAEAQARYNLFGARDMEGFLGVFNAEAPGPDTIAPLPPPYNTFATTKARDEHAVDFIIRTVRQYPNEVTIFCGGPLTNLALAVMMAPDIVPITQEVVFMGGGIHHSTSSFNVYFDSEAAKIAFRAGFPRFSVVTVDQAETMHMGDDGMVNEIVARAHSPIKDLFDLYEKKPHERNANLRWFRLPDEMMAAQIIDPTVFGGRDEMYVDVVVEPNGQYGSTLWWDADWAKSPAQVGTPRSGQNNPSPGAKVVHVLKDLDKKRFRDLFVGLLTKPIRKA